MRDECIYFTYKSLNFDHANEIIKGCKINVQLMKDLYIRPRMRWLILLRHVTDTFLDFALLHFTTPRGWIKCRLPFRFFLGLVRFSHSFVFLQVIQA